MLWRSREAEMPIVYHDTSTARATAQVPHRVVRMFAADGRAFAVVPVLVADWRRRRYTDSTLYHAAVLLVRQRRGHIAAVWVNMRSHRLVPALADSECRVVRAAFGGHVEFAVARVDTGRAGVAIDYEDFAERAIDHTAYGTTAAHAGMPRARYYANCVALCPNGQSDARQSRCATLPRSTLCILYGPKAQSAKRRRRVAAPSSQRGEAALDSAKV